ncbi:MAG: hypothetical protein U0975_16000 [Erythrobacter sp.]|nr:hypothetical protein [Erythrobacter sp.]MDZ4274163.1 hypothetical protein [Erythrobacter sp.]
MQTVIWQHNISDLDYFETINTLDQILRFHPQRDAEFFPSLVAALLVELTIPAFAEWLAKPLPWRDTFLNYAVGQPDALANPAVIRERVLIDNISRPTS